MVGTSESIEMLLSRIDDAFQSKVRLGISAALAASGSLDFKALKSALAATDGNLSSHLSYLERRGFVRVEKSFLSRRPHTELYLTEEGRLAFQQYLDALEAVLNLARKSDAL